MAFNIQGLGRTSSNFNSKSANSIYSYKSDDDDLAAIISDGYFNQLSNVINVGAHIFAKGTDGTALIEIVNNSTPVSVQFHTQRRTDAGLYTTSSEFPAHYPISTDGVNGTQFEFSRLRLTPSWNPVGFPENIDPVKDGVLFNSLAEVIDWTKPVYYQAFGVRDIVAGGGFFSPTVQFPFRTLENVQCWAYLYYDDPSTSTHLVLSQEAAGASWETQGFDIHLTVQFYKL